MLARSQGREIQSSPTHLVRNRRRLVALSIACSVSLFGNYNELCAQYSGGDLPASPWSSRGEVRHASNVNQYSEPSNEFLRQPNGNISHDAPLELRAPPSSESERPAAVMLLGPMAPKSSTKSSRSSDLSNAQRLNPRGTNSSKPISTATPRHALTQNSPIDAQSDWHRVQAGGLILDGPDASEQSAQRSGLASRRTDWDSGLPDRNAGAEQADRLPSQMASSSSTLEPGERLQLHSSSRRGGLVEAASDPMEEIGATSSPVAKPQKLASNVRMDSRFNGDSRDRVPSLERANSEAATTTALPANPVQVQRIALAQRLSHELVSQNPSSPSSVPDILEAPPGWQSVEQELRLRLDRCDSLLRRGAVHSSREETIQGLRRLCRTMDMYRRTWVSEPALDRALQALREDADFQAAHSQGVSVQAIVDTHGTEALKGRPLDNVSPEIASQHYRLYARYQLLLAADGHRWASDLLYAYGKTLEKEAEQTPDRSVMLRSQAVVCYQAATLVTPSQSEAYNQLGYALIHLDRIDEAYQALASSIQYKPSSSAWNNLAEVYRRRGAVADAEHAVQQASALGSSQPVYTAANPEITEVDPSLFAQYSPMPPMTQASVPAESPAKPRSGNSASNMLSKIFR